MELRYDALEELLVERELQATVKAGPHSTHHRF